MYKQAIIFFYNFQQREVVGEQFHELKAEMNKMRDLER